MDWNSIRPDRPSAKLSFCANALHMAAALSKLNRIFLTAIHLPFLVYLLISTQS